MPRLLRIPMMLLLALAVSSAPAASQDFVRAPAGSVLVTPAGDTLVVRTDSRVVSDSALVGVDLALRQARLDAAFHEENYNLRTTQFRDAQVLTDSLVVSLAVEKAWRDVALKELQRPDVSFVEKLLWGAGGYLLGRAATPGG